MDAEPENRPNATLAWAWTSMFIDCSWLDAYELNCISMFSVCVCVCVCVWCVCFLVYVCVCVGGGLSV